MSPRFIRMLRDLLRFNRQATAVALGHEPGGDLTLGEFLDRHRYGAEFRQWYLLPMAGAIWSCPLSTMLAYPAATFVRFCHNHGLLQVNDRPQWFTVAGGARQYVRKIAAGLSDVRLDDAAIEVTRQPGAHRVTVRSRRGAESFDHVVLACHSDQSLPMLTDADAGERSLLSDVRYQPNRAILHTDARLLPQSRKVWSAWNYVSDGGEDPAVAVTYLLNKPLGMVPAYRGSDDRGEVAKNFESLAAAARTLAAGHVMGIFPEGKSHDASRVEMVRSVPPGWPCRPSRQAQRSCASYRWA